MFLVVPLASMCDERLLHLNKRLSINQSNHTRVQVRIINPLSVYGNPTADIVRERGSENATAEQNFPPLTIMVLYNIIQFL